MKFTIIWNNFDTTGNEINIPYNNIAEFGSEISNPRIHLFQNVD